MCVKDRHRVPNRRAILGLQMNQNSGFRLFCWKVSSGFTSVLLSMLIGATFKDMYIWPSKAQFGVILGRKLSQNSGLWPFSQIVFTGLTSVLLQMLIANTVRCVENMDLRAPIFLPLWVKIPVFRSFSQKKIHWFRISLGAHVNLSYS